MGGLLSIHSRHCCPLIAPSSALAMSGPRSRGAGGAAQSRSRASGGRYGSHREVQCRSTNCSTTPRSQRRSQDPAHTSWACTGLHKSDLADGKALSLPRLYTRASQNRPRTLRQHTRAGSPHPKVQQQRARVASLRPQVLLWLKQSKTAMPWIGCLEYPCWPHSQVEPKPSRYLSPLR